MFKIIPDLKKLDTEVKEGINVGKHRLVRCVTDEGSFVLLMGNRAFILDNQGKYRKEVDPQKVPRESFTESLAFKEHEIGSINRCQMA